MGFSQATITKVNKPDRSRPGQIFVSWESSSPKGTFFQIYLNGQLAWWGTKRSTWLPSPTNLPRVDVGTVPAGSERTSFATAINPAPPRYAALSWKGGTYEDPDIAGFYVYSSDVANGPVDYTTAVGNITAYPGGIYTDGYGLGEYGSGGWGLADSDYSWTSGVLANGLWSFAVVPYDTAGNTGTASTTTVTIAGPPLPSPPFPNGEFLEYTYNSTTHVAVLSWEPSPG